MTHKQVEKYILSMPGAKLDYPFGEDVAVYFVKGRSSHKKDVVKGVSPDIPDVKSVSPDVPTANVGNDRVNPDADGRGRMFALIREKKEPVQLSLKCDPLLAENLRAKYESVLPGYHLNKKHWNTILLTGQLSWDEIKDLIRHSYNLVATDGRLPQN